MAKVVKHGWTHRPRSQGGTDPIEVAAGGLPVAFGSRGQESITVGSGSTGLPFSSVSWNDPDVFGYTVVTGSAPNKRARFVTATPGTYMYDAVVTWQPTDFSSGDIPFIQPTVYFPSIPDEDFLSNVIDVRSMDDAQGGIWGQQNGTAELTYRALRATVIFSWEEADFAEPFMGFGVNLNSGNARTKDFGAMMSLVRLGEAATIQTIT